MKSLLQNIKKTFKNILKDRYLSAVLALSTGIFVGVMVLHSSTLFQASLLQTNTSLDASEIAYIFTEVDNIKELEISALSSTAYLVEFFATQGAGDSLHPYSYVVTKENNTIISVTEISNAVEDEMTNESEELSF